MLYSVSPDMDVSITSAAPSLRGLSRFTFRPPHPLYLESDVNDIPGAAALPHEPVNTKSTRKVESANAEANDVSPACMLMLQPIATMSGATLLIFHHLLLSTIGMGRLNTCLNEMRVSVRATPRA